MKYVWIALFAMLVGCGNEKPVDEVEVETCGDDGEVFEGYCVYQQPITEEGFLCPIQFNQGLFTFGSMTLCAGPGFGPPTIEIRERLVQRYPLSAPAADCSMVVCEELLYCEDGVCGGVQTDPLAECLATCDSACPNAEAQVCTESGFTYCNTCLADCYEETATADLQTCARPDGCAQNCPTECEGDGVCASDNNIYCNRCEIRCNSLGVALPANCE